NLSRSAAGGVASGVRGAAALVGSVLGFASTTSSTDGRIGTMRGAVDRLAPLATIYVFGVSYDPFVSKRLSMLYRVEQLNGAPMVPKLAAIRPIVTSQILGAWLAENEGWFTEDEAARAVSERLAGLPPQRRHPQFPFVRDIVAYQAAFLQETLEHAAYGERLVA
ncbi:MAG TPA: hypothetical protein VGM99_01590, partial [Candidatus Cybelea sp.]